jgi:hypothetical protein
MITGIQRSWSVESWTPAASSLLTAFVQARASHER